MVWLRFHIHTVLNSVVLKYQSNPNSALVILKYTVFNWMEVFFTMPEFVFLVFTLSIHPFISHSYTMSAITPNPSPSMIKQCKHNSLVCFVCHTYHCDKKIIISKCQCHIDRGQWSLHGIEDLRAHVEAAISHS